MAITISGENNNDRILASDGVIDSLSGFKVVGVITATSFTGDLTGDVTGNLTGNVTGNINNSTLLLQTGGTERVRINSGGEVLIGTTTGTGNNLTVQDAGTSTTAGGNIVARFQSNGSGRDASIQLSDNVAHSALISMVSSNFGINLSGTERFRITSSGNIITNTSGGGVGIRTDTPTTTFHVRGAGVFTSQTGGTITNGLFLDPGDTGPGNRPDIMLKGAGSAALNNLAMQVYYNNGSNKAFHMRYDGGTYHQGNIGIGTESPNAPLQINNASPKIILEDNDNAADISIHNVGGAAVYSSAGDTVFQTANTSERLRITSDGKVVINKTSGDFDGALHVNAISENAITIEGSNAAINWRYTNGSAGYRGGIKWHSNGLVKFDAGVSGNSYYYAFHLNAAERLRIESDGDFRLSNGDAATNYGWIRGWHSSTGDMIIGADQSATGTGTSKSNLIFRSRGSEKMRITSGGQVRIGNENNLALWGQTNRLQVAGTDWNTSGVTIAKMGNSTATPNLVMGSSRGSTPGTAINNGDRLGYISFVGDDGTDLHTVGSAIVAGTDAAPSSNNIPGTLQFYTGSNTSTERLRITSSGNLQIGGGNLIVGDTANRLVWGINPALQVNGTTWNDSSIAIHNFGNNTNRPTLLFTKGRSGTLGNYGTPVNAGEGLGIIGWSAHDSTDAEILACYIQGISESAPTTNNQYGAITFTTVNGGTNSYERMRITKEGYIKTPYQPSFLATFGGNNNTSHNNGDYLKLNSMDHNTGNCYNTSNYRFTAPVAGNYLFYGRANMSGVGSGDYSRSYQVRLFKNGSSQQFHMSRTTLTGYSGSYPDTSTMVCSINLAANDYVQLKVNWETDGTLGTTENLHHHGSLFGGYLIG